MEEYLRTPTQAKGPLTPKELEKMRQISDFWIKNSYRTDHVDKNKITDAIGRLYQAANLKKPRVIIVPSPVVMALAYKISWAWWELNGVATRAATGAATRAATRDATRAATGVATWDATWDATGVATEAATRAATEAATRAATGVATRAATRAATWDATEAATRDATEAATGDATEAATWDATRAATGVATWDATWDATGDATEAATRDATEAATGDIFSWYIPLCKKFLGKQFKKALEMDWYAACQGGNMWAGFLSYAQACREVLKLTGLPIWEKYQAWEDAGLNGGFRVLHPKFCFVSEFPEKISIDELNRSHCETGPSHQWRDGYKLYHLHGTRMEHWMVRTPAEQLDLNKILSVKNSEQRMRLIQKVGIEKMLSKLQYKILDEKGDYALLNIEITNGQSRPFLKMRNPSTGTFHIEGVENGIGTVREAINWRWPNQMKFNVDWAPEILT